ncbi:hypothetical protein GW17_00000622 [Ensete ventricosum]|nr:hypothetical protein GW17_00000622 [Ensete ventricosum]
MKSCHNFDSVVIEDVLVVIWECYSISDKYALHAQVRSIQLISKWVYYVRRHLRGGVAVPTSPHDCRVSQVVADFTGLGSTELVALHDYIPREMLRVAKQSIEETTRPHKQVKVLSYRHKSYLSKGKEPVGLTEEATTTKVQ